HVLAGVIARAFDHDRRAAVANREPLAGPAGNKRLAAARAVKGGVADRGFARCAGRPHDDPAALHALADVVVRVAVEFEGETLGEKSAETLTGGTGIPARGEGNGFAAFALEHDVMREARAD